MVFAIHSAYAIIKKSAAIVNMRYKLKEEKGKAII